jgi:PAS domain S-box-containing protein
MRQQNGETAMDVTNELAKQLLDAAPDPTVIVDQDGTVVFANARVAEVLGYTSEELIGEPVEILLPERARAAHPGHRHSFFANPNARPMGDALELHALRKDGTEIPVEISLSPVVTADGVLVSSAIRDVSGQKEVERQLVEANRAKSRFLAAASHDLRQPIQTLNLLNRAAKSTTTSPTHLNIIDKQQKSLDSMSNLLNALLDISKLEAGIVKPDITDCAVQNIFESLTAAFEEQARDKGLELIIDRCHGVARSDARLLTQILENLMSNAIRYTHEGFVRLRCRHGQTGIRIEVMDTGLGIPPEELGQIFDEFHQVDSGSYRPEGLGLGLSIVKRTAKLLGCSVDVRSSPGEGSSFFVDVPEGTESSIEAAAKDDTPLQTAKGGRILIVDDETSVVDATCMLLEMEGFDVVSAASIDQVMASIHDTDTAPDLLITDYHLRGGETGLAVIRAVRDRFDSKVPVIVLSGDTSNRIVLAELEGITFFTKPVDVDALLVEVHRLLGNS